MRKIAYLWQNYNLSIILVVLFLVCWILQTIAGWYEFQSEQKSLGEVARVWGGDGYIWAWLRATFENWQSEFLQLASFVILTAYFVHKGSHESKDNDIEVKELLTRIENRISALEHRSSK